MKILICLLGIPVILAAGISPSNITVVASANPSVYGSAVTLTANVTPVPATGKVTFYDGTAVLGTSVLSGSQAALTTIVLAAGSRSLTARYSGDATYAASTSHAIAQTVNTIPANTFGPAASYSVGGYVSGASFSVIGDFNGDRKADLAVAAEKLAVFLGNGDGTFLPVLNYQDGNEPDAYAVAVADFNADGRPDLAVLDQQYGAVSVFLGNGDGTFQAQVRYVAGGENTGPRTIAVADFNNDGSPDLVVGSIVGTEVLLGNGDGTFQTAVRVTSYGLTYVAVADFNGDGNADLAVTGTGNPVSILLGNGDGTFRMPVTAASGGTPPVNSPGILTAGDFNGDGKPDVAFLVGNNVGVLLGKGDGTFLPQASYTAGEAPQSVVVGDINGDGKSDLVIAVGGGENVAVLLGNGDGSFQSPVTYGTAMPGAGAGPASAIVGDFNGDGRTDIAVAPFNGTTVSILLGAAVGPDLAISKTHTGNFRQGQTGVTYTITVSNAGNASTSGTVSVVDSLPQGLTATAVAGTGWSCALGPVTCTRADPLSAAGVYPVITVTADLAADAASVITNTAMVSGGGDNNTTNNTASDPANLFLTPVTFTTNNAADSSRPPLAPGSIASLSGSNLAYGHAQVSAGQWPGKLANVTVTVNGVPAPLELVSPSQIVFQVPYETANEGSDPKITVTNEGGQSFPRELIVAPASPGIFASLTLNSDSTPNSARQPAIPGSAITVFFTGAGFVVPAVADGAPAPSSPPSIPTLPVAVSLGGSTAAILSVALSPGMVGVAQAVVSIPAGLAPGSYPIALTMNSTASAPATVYVGGPAPIITSIMPNYALAGTASIASAINGLNLGGGSTVSFQTAGGLTTTLTPTTTASRQLIVEIPQQALIDPGTAHIAVLSGLGISSNSVPFYVTPFAISTVTPNSAMAGSGDTAITITGQNLATAASLSFTPPGGPAVSIPLIQVQTSQVQATIPAALLTSAGTTQIALANAGLAFSNSLFFTIAASLPSTGTSLTSSANPSTYGRPVTLTAAVAPSSATGSVTFYDGSTVLGTSPLVNGRAAFTTGLVAAGSRSLKAHYSGDARNGPGTSPVLTQGVNALADNGFLAPVNYLTGNSSLFIAAGDFNGDGKTDIVTTDDASNKVSVMLGNGDGTFHAIDDFSVSPAPVYVAVGDFNMDGRADIAVTNRFGIDVLLGNGDGTFQPAMNIADTAGAISVGDFNGDGKPDLVVTDGALGGVDVFLGNGDGTFAQGVFYATGGAQFIAAGDFNGDGIADLAVLNDDETSINFSNVSVLLGRGDGTFQPAMNYTPYPNSNLGPYLAVADFNGDGKLDLAGSTVNGMYVSLGHGDGTFGPAAFYGYGASTLNFARSIVVGDFNGDGRVDLAVAEPGDFSINCLPTCYSAVGVFPGKGDGTFQAATNYATASAPSAMVVGDFNGDGRPDLAANGVFVLLGTTGQSTQTITFDPISDVMVDTGSVPLLVIASSGLPVTSVSNTPDVCTVSGNGAPYPAARATIAAIGTCSITATQSGNAIYPSAAPVTQSFTVHASAGGPVITPGGIVPIFSSSTAIQPGSWVSIYGTNFASAIATWTGNFPTSLGGVSVKINGKYAYLWYVSATQINLQAPDDAATGPVSVTVTNAAGSWTSTVVLQSVAPSFCLLDGKHVAAIILRSDGSGAYGGGTYDIVGPAGTSLGYPTVPAAPGDVLEVFGVGFGPTSPAILAGQAFSGAAATTNQVQLTVGGATVTPFFAGLSSAGLFQINVTIPAGLGTGDMAFAASVGGRHTDPGVVISLQ